MTPQEKARELFNKGIYIIQMADKYQYLLRDDEKYLANQIALNTANELIQQMPSVYVTPDEEIHAGHRQYWEEVKKQLESF